MSENNEKNVEKTLEKKEVSKDKIEKKSTEQKLKDTEDKF